MKETRVQAAEERKQDPSPEGVGLQIPPKALKLAKSVGIDLQPLVDWGFKLNARVQAQGQALEQLGVKLQPLIDAVEIRNKQIQAMQQQQQSGQQMQQGYPQMQGNPLAFLAQMGLGSGGGSGDIEKKVMGLALESLGLGNALMKAVIIKTAPDLASTIIKQSIPATVEE